MNNAPFYVGQIVVRTGPSTIELRNGNNYTICFVSMCGCGRWSVSVSEVKEYNRSLNECTNCQRESNLGMYNANYFAPISEQYADITAEIAAGAERTDEKPDVVKIKEPVNN